MNRFKLGLLGIYEFLLPVMTVSNELEKNYLFFLLYHHPGTLIFFTGFAGQVGRYPDIHICRGI